MRPGFRITLAAPEHLPALAAIERVCADLFDPGDLPLAVRAHTTPLDELDEARREGRLWIALAPDGAPVGFALAGMLGGEAYLEEIDVHPAHGRQGLGSALVREVVGWAAARAPTLVLTTFGQVSWNGPYYRKLGFRVLAEDELSRELAAQLALERLRGLIGRVAMRIDLALGDVDR